MKNQERVPEKDLEPSVIQSFTHTLKHFNMCFASSSLTLKLVVRKLNISGDNE